MRRPVQSLTTSSLQKQDVWEGALQICPNFDGCPISWATAKSDSDGGAASIDGILGRPGAPVNLAGTYRGQYNMGPLSPHSDPYYVYADGARGGMTASFN
mmetsp:Transcript_65467/g.95906  ORF Transcript_65467/g.95906 Transcript_65467/m.95906 type:complete len:100 (+) Transcript_65467:140-439(+)